MSTPARPVVRNASRRPVELHLSGGTVVLMPGETTTAPEDDPYCQVLERRGLLTRHPAPKPAARRHRARKTAAKAAKKSPKEKTPEEKTPGDRAPEERTPEK